MTNDEIINLQVHYCSLLSQFDEHYSKLLVDTDVVNSLTSIESITGKKFDNNFAIKFKLVMYRETIVSIINELSDYILNLKKLEATNNISVDSESISV